MIDNKKLKKSWKNTKWYEFAEKVKKRDGYKCLKCERYDGEITLQVHHEVYRANKEPWEYALSDCISLCKGCHAVEHNLIEPTTGWFLIAVDDIGDLSGTCERKNCNSSIRYEHLTYHPKWGYKIVGSTCIEHLTQEDKLLSSDVLKVYKQISKLITKSYWGTRFTQKSNKYIESEYKYHKMRIYGKESNYSFQIVLKSKGERWYEYGAFIPIKNRSLEEVQELAYITLLGTITEKETEKELLRNIYANVKKATS